jgi:hypothetical protein
LSKVALGGFGLSMGLRQRMVRHPEIRCAGGGHVDCVVFCATPLECLRRLFKLLSELDLRDRLNPSQIDCAGSVLDYQPFIITDELQTGMSLPNVTG